MGNEEDQDTRRYRSKTLKGDHGEIEIDIPRYRNGSFEPQLIRKGQTRMTQFDDRILSLYARGMSTRDIVATFKEMYDADVSARLTTFGCLHPSTSE